MSITRLIIKFFTGTVLGGSTLYGATKLKIASEATEEGLIEHVMTDKNKNGHYINNNNLYLKHLSPTGSASLLDAAADLQKPFSMDLENNDELIKKAKQYCKNQTIVEVKYDHYLFSNFFKGKPSRKVLSIDEVRQDKNRFRL